MAKQIIVGDLIFTTKKAAIEYMKPILNDSPIDSIIPEPGHGFLTDLLQLHPDADVKIGCGVTNFSVERNEYSQRGFRLHRLDGTSTDFSVYKCFDGKHNRKAQVQLALRTATMQQISRFREEQLQAGENFCPFSSELLHRNNCHVDHTSPMTFDQLFNTWMNLNGLTIETVNITDSADNKQGREMTNPLQVTSWQNFHQQNAKLRLVSIRGNLSNAKVAHNRSTS